MKPRFSILVGALALLVGLAAASVLVGAAGLSQPVIVNIRLPRIGVGILAGFALGAAGVALQGLFRNPLADGHLIGIAPAAGLGALVGYALTPGKTLLPLVVGLAAVAGVIYSLGFGRINRSQVLIGLSLSLGTMAWLGVVSLVWNNSRVPTLTYWLFGGLGASTWDSVYVAVVPVLASIAVMLTNSRSLDVMSLGESEARHLGVPVEKVRRSVLAAAGVGVGAAVAVSGVIAFVGLLGPLVMRRLLGPSHRYLLIGSALSGAIILLGADLVARTVAAPIEVPVGLITSMLGAPVMAGILIRRTAP